LLKFLFSAEIQQIQKLGPLVWCESLWLEPHDLALKLKHNHKPSNVYIHISCILFLVYWHFIALIQIREKHPKMHCTSTASVEFLFIQQCPPTKIFLKALENRASGVGPRPRSRASSRLQVIDSEPGQVVALAVMLPTAPLSPPFLSDFLGWGGVGAD
jgi:hypothetical protein